MKHKLMKVIKKQYAFDHADINLLLHAHEIVFDNGFWYINAYDLANAMIKCEAYSKYDVMRVMQHGDNATWIYKNDEIEVA